MISIKTWYIAVDLYVAAIQRHFYYFQGKYQFSHCKFILSSASVKATTGLGPLCLHHLLFIIATFIEWGEWQKGILGPMVSASLHCILPYLVKFSFQTPIFLSIKDTKAQGPLLLLYGSPWEKKKSLCLVHKDSPIMSSSFVHGGKVVPAASNLLSVFFTDTN